MRLKVTSGFLLMFLVAAFWPILLTGQNPLVKDPYEAPSVGQKAEVFAYRVISPNSLAKSAVTAGLNQWRDSPPEWGQGMAGYGRRYGHKIATRGAESGIGFVTAAALHEDPRYFRLSEGTFGERIRHALKSTFVTHKDDGGQGPSIWRFTSNYGAQFVSNAWRPESETQVGETLRRGTVSIGYDAATNLFKEFWPDIRRRVFRH